MQKGKDFAFVLFMAFETHPLRCVRFAPSQFGHGAFFYELLLLCVFRMLA